MTEPAKKRGRPVGSKNKTKYNPDTKPALVTRHGRPKKTMDVTPLPDAAFSEPKWEQMEGESIEDFKLFTVFRTQGPHRHFSRLFDEDLRVLNPGPNTSTERKDRTRRYEALATMYRWKERIDAYEAACLREEVAIIEQRVKDERDQRYDMITRSRAKLLEFIDALDPNIHEVRPHELLKLGALINQDSREEFEVPIREKAKLEAKKENTLQVNNLAGVLALALQHANSKELEAKQARNSAANIRELPDANPIEAEYKTLDS